jgi:uncharacterized protein YukE
VSDSFQVTPSTLTDAGSQFETESTALTRSTQQATDQLCSLGDVYGQDRTGRRFYNQYEPQRQAVLSNLGLLATGLDHIANGLNQMADNYTNAEGASTFAPGSGAVPATGPAVPLTSETTGASGTLLA